MTAPFARRLARSTAALRARPVAVLRRVFAVALLLLAVFLAAGPATADGDGTRPTLVFARDLPLGTTLKSADVRVVDLPESARPAGALGKPDKIAGQRLVGVAREGEPVTDARTLDALPAPPGTVTVPVRLGDSDVAPLVRSGSRVDVVALGPDTGDEAGEQVLASDVPVMSVVPSTSEDSGPTSPSEDGPLLLVAARPDPAARLAAVSLSQPVTVTLR